MLISAPLWVIRNSLPHYIELAGTCQVQISDSHENQFCLWGARPPVFKACGFSATPHTGFHPVTPRLSWLNRKAVQLRSFGRAKTSGGFPILRSFPCSGPQRAATAKAVSPFPNTSHIFLRWNDAHFLVPTANAVHLWFPLSPVPCPLSLLRASLNPKKEAEWHAQLSK